MKALPIAYPPLFANQPLFLQKLKDFLAIESFIDFANSETQKHLSAASETYYSNTQKPLFNTDAYKTFFQGVMAGRLLENDSPKTAVIVLFPDGLAYGGDLLTREDTDANTQSMYDFFQALEMETLIVKPILTSNGYTFEYVDEFSSLTSEESDAACHALEKAASNI